MHGSSTSYFEFFFPVIGQRPLMQLTRWRGDAVVARPNGFMTSISTSVDMLSTATMRLLSSTSSLKTVLVVSFLSMPSPHVGQTEMNVSDLGINRSTVKPNTHRRRRHDETVLSRRVGVGGVYMNSQLAHDDCRRIRRCERSRCRWPWPSLQFCSQCYGSRIWRNIWRCMFVNIRICCVV